jgi:hypothetical protein
MTTHSEIFLHKWVAIPDGGHYRRGYVRDRMGFLYEVAIASSRRGFKVEHYWVSWRTFSTWLFFESENDLAAFLSGVGQMDKPKDFSELESMEQMIEDFRADERRQLEQTDAKGR